MYLKNINVNKKISIGFLEKNKDMLLPQFAAGNENITENFFEKYSKTNFNMKLLSENTFSKSILEDNNNYKNRKELLLAEFNKENNAISRFSKNILFDPNVNRIIFSFLSY